MAEVGSAHADSLDHGTHARALASVDRLWAAALLVCCFVSAWISTRGSDGDTIAYFDLSNAVRYRDWHACINGGWFPLYPALLTLARGLFHFNPAFDQAAARLLDGACLAAMCAASVSVTAALREYAASRGMRMAAFPAGAPLYLCIATLTYFLGSLDMAGVKPDVLQAALLLWAIAALFAGLRTLRWRSFALAGAVAGLSFWAKSFSFPFFCLLLLCVGIATLRQRGVLLRLVVCTLVFAAVMAPYIGWLSHDRGRFTIGDAGRLNSAWYVNGAERFNPVADTAIDSRDDAAGSYRHPAELLATSPEVVYFAPGRVAGHMPAWDDFTFWSDGLHPRVVPRDYLHAALHNLRVLALLLPMRLQAIVLLASFTVFGFRLRRLVDLPPATMALAAAALLSVVLYVLVHLEGRYVVFAAVLLAAVWLTSLTAPGNGTADSGSPTRGLHLALLLLCTMVCVADVEELVHAVKGSGDSPLHARFAVADSDAGHALATHVAAASEVACLGIDACYGDALWSWYGDVTVSATVSLPHEQETASPDEVCTVLSEHPAALDALRSRGIRAVVARFPTAPACVAGWQPLAGGYFYLPI